MSCQAVRGAIAATAGYRGVDLAPLSAMIGTFAAVRARTWVAYRRSLGRREEELPGDLTDVVADVAVFADGALGGHRPEHGGRRIAPRNLSSHLRQLLSVHLRFDLGLVGPGLGRNHRRVRSVAEPVGVGVVGGGEGVLPVVVPGVGGGEVDRGWVCQAIPEWR